MTEIEVFTDGSATTSDKSGGWAYCIVVDGKIQEKNSGHMISATNNDAELMAALMGLNSVHNMIIGVNMGSDSYNLTLCSDSQIILGWISGTSRFNQTAKMDKYREILKLRSILKINTKWIKGHSGNEFNELCDKMANAARLQKEFKPRESNGKTQKSLIGRKKAGIICIFYKDVLKLIDLEKNIIEDHDREIHGSRGSTLEIREDRRR